jgi:hypothetical protein
LPKENDKQKNHFLALVEEYGDVIEEKHLEMLLKSELDLISKVYTWILTAFIGVAATASAVKVVIDPSSILGWLPLILVAVFVILFIALYKTVTRIDPLKLKRNHMEKFLIAKRHLAEIKNKKP